MKPWVNEVSATEPCKGGTDEKNLVDPRTQTLLKVEGISMSQSLSSLIFHFVFSTKHRRHQIPREIQPRLHKFIAGTLRSRQSKLLAAGGMPDHLHLLASLNRQISVSDALQKIKSNSSRWIHESFPELNRFAWQNGYAAFSVSFSHIEHVKRYIQNQERHHRKRTFKEELLLLLKEHLVEFDQRYLWD